MAIDYDLKFEKRLSELCKKVNRKLNAMSWQGKHLVFLKRKLMIKTLNESQYHYWCVIWIFVTGNKQIKQTS